MNKSLLQKIQDKKAVVGVIGLGYVGLPLNLCFVEKGLRSIGFDVDQTKVDALLQCKSYIKHIPAERIASAIQSKLFDATGDFSRLEEYDKQLRTKNNF